MEWTCYGQRPATGEVDNDTFPILQMKDKETIPSRVPSQSYRIKDITFPAPNLLYDYFSLESRRSHGVLGELHVHIPCVVFEQSFWRKNVHNFVFIALE